MRDLMKGVTAEGALARVDAKVYKTPLTDLPDRRVGDARLATTHYRGYYHMEGVGGATFYQTHRGWLPVRVLQRRYDDPGQTSGRRPWHTWMVDDPLHWLGMREWVNALPPGRLLVGGLGMGLMLHHLYAERPDITDITVVELDGDVIDLIVPTLPAGLATDPNVTLRIVQDDYYRVLTGGAALSQNPRHRIGASRALYDGILWDLAVGGKDEANPDIIKGIALAKVYAPGTPVLIFGARRKDGSLDWSDY